MSDRTRATSEKNTRPKDEGFLEYTRFAEITKQENFENRKAL